MRAGRILLALAATAAIAAPAHGATGDLELVDRATDGTPGDGFSAEPAMTPDGRFVAFASDASNLSPDDLDATRDVFVRDLVAGTTTLVSRATGADGAAGNAGSFEPSISADGRYVAFTSRATNLAVGADRDFRKVFVRDLQTNTTALVSRGPGEAGAPAAFASYSSAISGDGRFVTFHSLASDLTGTQELANVVYLRELSTGAVTVASRADGLAGAAMTGEDPSISRDGRFVAFESGGNVWLRNVQAGITVLVSRATGAAGVSDSGLRPSVSADGRYVAFDSNGTRLSDRDADETFTTDVFVRDVQGETTTLASEGAISGHAILPSISADGHHVSFVVFPYGLGGPQGFYAYTLGDAAPASVTEPELPPIGNDLLTGAPAISGDGRYVAFAAPTRPFLPDVTPHNGILRRDVLGPPPGEPAAVCLPSPAPSASRDGEAHFTLSRGQLLINQRVAQAAIRRLNAVQARLDAGLTARDLCAYGIGAADLDPSIVTDVAPASLAPADAAAPEPIRPAAGGGGSGATVRLTAAQLLINQRIGQAAVRRANAIEARLAAGLTGGDIADGQVGQGKLADRLRVAGTGAAAPQAPSETVIPPRTTEPDPASVRLTAAQLRIDQRIFQAAVRRANALVARLEAGIAGDAIRDGSLTAADLAPGVAPPA